MRIFSHDCPFKTLATLNGSKFERTMDVYIVMCDVEPAKGYGVLHNHPKYQWMNKACVCHEGWMKDILTTIELNPITLVNCIVSPIGGMANVKFKQETSVLCARRINRDGVIECDPSEAPFPCIVCASTVGDKIGGLYF